MAEKVTSILLIGPPGVGKTTLLRKICEELVGVLSIDCLGFYTEEVRTAGVRVGFDAVTLSGERKALARDASQISHHHGPKVGKYSVYINEFEELVMPLFRGLREDNKQLLVIDEIGKMELLSKNFDATINNIIGKVFLFATIPSQTRQPITTIERLKGAKTSKIFEITKRNRNQIQEEIISNIKEMISK